MATQANSPEYLAENCGALLLNTAITFLVLEATFMILFYTSRYIGYRTKERTSVPLVVLLTLTWFTCMTKIILCIMLVKYGGAGRHMAALDKRTRLLSTKLGMSLNIVCPLTTSLSKLGVLCLYYRIFNHISRTYRVVIRATFVLVVGVILTQILTSVLNCRPYSWDWYPKGPLTCRISQITLFRFQDLPNLITTFIVAALPVPGLFILRPRFSRPVRIGLVAILCICCLAVAACIMRFVSFYRFTSFDDFSFVKVKPLSWAVVESGLYVIACVCMTLRPLLSWAFKDTLVHKIMAGQGSKASSTFWASTPGRKWFRGGRPSTLGEQKSSSLSDESGEGVEYVSTELHKQPDRREKC